MMTAGPMLASGGGGRSFMQAEIANEIVHDENTHRFVLVRDGRESYLLYRVIDPLTMDFVTTWVHPELRGDSIGTQLIEHALDWAKSIGVKIIPSCWFVAEYLHGNPDYRSLVSSRS